MPKVFICDIEGLDCNFCNHILGENQRLLNFSFDGILETKAIITEDEKDNRMFGGAFVKIAVKGIDDIFVSTSMDEDRFKFFINKEFGYLVENLYRFY